MILDIYNELMKAHGETERRLRIEHAQHMAAKDFDGFASLHVIASVQPYHAIDDGHTIARAAHMHSAPSKIMEWVWHLEPTGVAPLNPMLTLYAAVRRATLDEQKSRRLVSRAEADIRRSTPALHDGFGVCGISGAGKRDNQCWQAGRYGAGIK